MDKNEQVVPTLDHVIGQKTAVAVLRTAIDSYFYDRSKSSEEQAFARAGTRTAADAEEGKS